MGCEGPVESLQWRPERGRAMAVAVGGEHWQSRAKRAAATAAGPALPVRVGRYCPCVGKLNSKQARGERPPGGAGCGQMAQSWGVVGRQGRIFLLCGRPGNETNTQNTGRWEGVPMQAKHKNTGGWEGVN
jgi:hypothetical protein